LITAGMLSSAAGMLLLTGIDADATYLAGILAGLLLVGAGMALVIAPGMASATIFAVGAVVCGLLLRPGVQEADPRRRPPSSPTDRRRPIALRVVAERTTAARSSVATRPSSPSGAQPTETPDPRPSP
jgi:hypothetical protein